MNWKNLIGVISLMLLFFISCDVENTGNNQKKEKFENKEKLEENDNSIPVFRYLEKRTSNDLPLESWLYDSKGELSEYCSYDSTNTTKIKVTVYDSDSNEKKAVGYQIVEYGKNNITGETEVLKKETYNISNELLEVATKTIKNSEVVSLKKTKTEVLESKKCVYKEKLLSKEFSYSDEEQKKLTEEKLYEYDAENDLQTVITKNYFDTTQAFYTKYFYDTENGKYSRKESFLLSDASVTMSSDIDESDIKDYCEVVEYEYDSAGDVVKEHVISDGKDQNYTLYTYGEYKGNKYKQNVCFYNNAETDNHLVEKNEYHFYDDNDEIGKYFYEEIRYCYSDRYDYEENNEYTYTSRSGKKTLIGTMRDIK